MMAWCHWLPEARGMSSDDAHEVSNHVQDGEDLLAGTPSGTFLVRVAESRFGYSLSMQFQGRFKHFMIDQDAANRYMV